MTITQITPEFTFYDTGDAVAEYDFAAEVELAGHGMDDLVFNRKSNVRNLQSMTNGDGFLPDRAVSTLHEAIMDQWRITERTTPLQEYHYGLFKPVGMIWDGSYLTILHYAPNMSDLIVN